MSDPLAVLQSQTGLDLDLVKKGLGAVLNFLKEQLPDELYEKVAGAVPQAGETVSAFLSGKKDPGLLDKVGGLIGNLLGGKGGELPKLFEMLAATGLSIDQAKEFLPKVIEFLKSHLPADVLDQVMDRVPGLGELLKTAGE